MKVAIIRPPVLMPAFNMADLVVPPLGPAYIAGAVRAAGHDIHFIDAVGSAIEQYTPYERGTLLHGLTFEEIIERVPKDVDCIGVSIQFSFEWPVGRDLLKRIRQSFPNVLFIAGGEHVTAIPEMTLEQSALDCVIIGEGEVITCDLLQKYAQMGKAAFAEVSGICYRDESGKAVKTARAKRVSEIGTIPRPAWDLLPMEEYLKRGYGFGVNRGRSMPVLASRGCPYQCTFCSNPNMWGTNWKVRDGEELLDELQDWQNIYGATNFDFYDLTAIVDRQWIINFCHAIERRKMKFTWQLPSGTRSEAIDGEVTSLLYRTGCRNISYSPESGSIETLTLIKKRVKIDRLMASMRSAVKSKLNVKCNIIFGFPHESWKNIFQSLWTVFKAALIGIHDLSIWVFSPYPGSELFTQLRANGKIAELNDDYFYRLASYADMTKTFSYCEKLNKKKLLYARLAGTALFYGTAYIVRPWRPFIVLRNSITGKLESRSELALRGVLKRLYKLLTYKPITE